MNDKQTGSFYTPLSLVKYMSNYAIQKRNSNLILEPSVGDGRFINELLQSGKYIDAVEKDYYKIQELSVTKKENVELICSNFIKYSLESDKKYNLIIGNPPYISKKNLSEDERHLSWEIIKYWSLPDSIFQNLWVSFVLGALKLLDHENGAIFFVLPFEFLQVHYAEKLRKFLEEKFNLIEITTFQESVFPDIEQDVCLVYLSNEKDHEPIVKYTTVKNLENFEPIESSEIRRNKPLKKWSNSLLNDDEIELLKNLSTRYTRVSDLGNISPGIVTGANKFFILNNNNIDKLQCGELKIPIIQRGSSIANLLILTDNDFNRLIDSNEAVCLLSLTGIERSHFSFNLKEYLFHGEELEIHKRYKCGKRKRWHDVPIIPSGELMFFRRYNKVPRLIVNTANVYTTDTSYNIRLTEKFDAHSVAFCFYNSLTLTLCEYSGRFYGGGVAELVPSEFKSLRLPYRTVNKVQVAKLDKMIRNNNSIEEIIEYVDNIVLNDLSNSDLESLKSIRNKYLLRRLKRNH